MLVRLARAETAVQEQLRVRLRAQVLAGLETLPGVGRGQPDVPERRAVGGAPPDEVPGTEVQVLVVHMVARGGAEVRTAAVVVQDPGPQFAHPVHECGAGGASGAVGGHPEGGEVPGVGGRGGATAEKVGVHR